MSAATLDPGQIAFPRGGLPQLVPHRLRHHGLLLKAKPQAVQRDIFASGAIAVAFIQPSTHRTMQLKSRDARVTALQPQDAQLVEAYCDAFVVEVGAIGFRETMVRTLLACPPQELVALSFCPSEAYSQTPGPNASKRLQAGK